MDTARRKFEELNSESARAAYADKWINLNAAALETTWPMLYELLRIVRDRELYKQPTMDRKETYDSFEAYFEATFGRSFEYWVELERTYHFAERYAPRLFDGSYSAARLHMNGGDRRSEGFQSDNTRLNYGSVAYWLARLERDAPQSVEVAAELERVRSGSSANAAVRRLGWRSPKHCKSCRCFDELALPSS